MKTKSHFILFIFIVQLCAAEASNYETFKLKDQFKTWLEISFDKVLSFDENEEYDAAENLCDSVLIKLWREPKTKDEFDAIFNINLYKAIYLQDKGNISKASTYFEIALKQFQKSNQKNTSDLSFIYPKLGNNYTRLGDNDNAILVHQKMIEYAKQEKDYEALVQALINISIVYENKADINKALSYLNEAELYFDDISNFRKALVYSNKGNYLFEQNPKNINAEIILKKARSLYKIRSADSYYSAGVFKTLALIKFYKKDIKKGQLLLLKSLEYYKISRQNRSREIAKVYIELSKISAEKEKGNFLNESLSYLTSKKELSQLKTSDLYAENTFVELLSEAIHLEPDHDIKLKYYDFLFEVQKLLRQEYIFDNSKLDLLSENNNRIEEALNICLKQFNETKQENYVFKALEYVENSKSILLFESLIKEVDNVSKSNYQDYILKKKQIVNLLVEAKKVKDESKIFELEKDLNALVFQFEIDNSEFNNAIQQSNSIQFSTSKFKEEYLKENESLMSYFFGEKKLFIININKKNSKVYALENNEELKNTIQSFASLFQFKNRFNFDKKLASTLGNILIKKQEAEIKKIIVLTDGFLNNIPFEALIKDDKFLIEKHEIQYAFSANILQNLETKKQNNKEIIAFAPIFKNDDKKFLKNSEKEVKSILEKLKGKSLQNEEATTKSFLNESKKYSVIHVSTHSKIDEKTNSASIDFIDKTLYFSQIKDEKFNADLLVLSACETGIGLQKIGEGSMSISRAFAYSNIDAFVSSLWKVNEESSLFIFNDFYTNISLGKSISESLRLSKLSYISNPKISEEKKTPYYWAPYVFVGKDKVLNIKTYSSLNLYVFILFLILACMFFIWKFKK